MASDVSHSPAGLRADFDVIRRNEGNLSAELYYLAGLCQSITGLQLKVLEKFMGLVGRAKRSQEVSEEEYLGLCMLVKEGRLGDAKSALEACRVASQQSIRVAMPAQKPPVPQPREDITELVRKLEAEERRKEAEAKRKSEELAARLQLQYQREVEALAEQQARANLVCQKCKNYVVEAEGVRECGHIFHHKCLEESITARIREGVYPLPCPTSQCTAEVTLSDIANIKPSLRQWANVTMQGYQYFRVHPDTMISCPTAGCSHRIFFQGQADFYCPSCNNRYCLRCRSALHPGTICEMRKPYLTSSDFNKMFEFVKMGVPMKSCPTCMLWNVKPTNQQSLTCLCGVTFCTLCGMRGGRNCLCQNPFAFK